MLLAERSETEALVWEASEHFLGLCQRADDVSQAGLEGDRIDGGEPTDGVMDWRCVVEVMLASMPLDIDDPRFCSKGF